MYILPIDELNVFTTNLEEHFDTDPETGKRRIKSEQDKEDIIDEMFDLLMMAYRNGTISANMDLSAEITPEFERVEQAIYKPIAGRTWKDRIEEYASTECTPFDIQRIAETDMTRIFNTAVIDVGNKFESERWTGSVMKVWNTMLDDRVRDTHAYLESIRVPLLAEFYTFDGDHALAPGMFEMPENNINCRCTISLRRG
mgnify:CR=1 FL=1